MAKGVGSTYRAGKPGIEISSYKLPLAENPGLMGVAVVYVTEKEAELIKYFAEQVKLNRGRAWVPTTSSRPTIKDVLAGGWTKRMNMLMDREEFIAPDGVVYVRDFMDSDGTSLAPLGIKRQGTASGEYNGDYYTCRNGHVLPTETSWCTECEKMPVDPNDPDGVYAPKREIDIVPNPRVEPEPERMIGDRFSGLEID